MPPLTDEQPQLAALHLPPSPPRQGIIRLVQHDKDEKSVGKGKGYRGQGKVDSFDQHSRKSGQSHHHLRSENQTRATRIDQESNRAKNEERDSPSRRDISTAHSGRDSATGGGVSTFSRVDSSADQTDDRTSRSHHHHHHHHHHNWPPHAQDPSRGSHNHQRGWGVRERDADQSSRLDVDSQSSSTRPGQLNATGKLFDPRKDDPVRFASLKTKYGMQPSFTMLHQTNNPSAFSAPSSGSDIRSVTSTDQGTNASSDGRERRRRRGPSSRTTNESNEKKKGAGGEGDSNNSYVMELKRWYREISTVEHTLQEEHRSASEKQRRDQGEASSSTNLSTIRSRANRPGYTSLGALDHTYWLNLISQHRQLAELHAAFMEAALKPGLPASLHSLPQNYNIPTRLWHTAFHSLLERLRHTLPSSPSNVVDHSNPGEVAAFKELQGEILDLLTEFIYFAYSFYSHLLESETFRLFRSSWIENLGDLARYRMAVAKVLAKQESIERDKVKTEDKGQAGEDALEGAKEAGTVDDVADKDKASIGSGALQDWDFDEKETWRATAKDWYAKGLAEMPGIGRLHHHLGILSRDDELRALHHFCKSLTSSHPYLSARESILPLFEREHQTRRLEPKASSTELFVHLHGILFTKVQLDDFEKVFVRFQERLQVDVSANGETEETSYNTLSMSSWMMMATVNVASLLQYGADATEPAAAAKSGVSASNESADVKTTSMEEDEVEDGEREDVQPESEKRDNVATVQPPGSPDKTSTAVEAEKPVTVRYAARLTFAMLSSLLLAMADQGGMRKVNPYVTMILTFLSQECKQAGLLSVMEEFIPWQELLQLGNNLPATLDPIDPRRDVPHRIRGDSSPLSEDWCLRGMAWVGRRVYERGFWKASNKNVGSTRGPSCPHYESEIEVLDRCATCSSAAHEVSSSGESGEEEEAQGVNANTPGAALTTLKMLRWKRVAYTLTILIKTIPGLDFEPSGKEGKAGLLLLTSPLKEKVEMWTMEQDLARQRIGSDATMMGRIKEEDRAAAAAIAGETSDGDEEADDDDDDDYDDSDLPAEIRDLKERRRRLRRQLKEGKLVLTSASKLDDKEEEMRQLTGRSTQQKKLSILAGYTTLVLDTNVMLTPTSVLEQLIESKQWCSVVPLVVITELEGLTKRAGPIGQRAQRAIEYLTNNLKGKANYVKVQTSRGNYLNDMRFRTEDIDFSSSMAQHSGPAGRHASGGQDDDEDDHHRMARSIDEIILFCLQLQTDNHLDRSGIFSRDGAELAQKQAQIQTGQTVKAALITLDKNLRVKARFRGLVAVGPNDLVDLLVPETAIATSSSS